MAARYQLTAHRSQGIDHGLGYAALRNGSIDVKDAYSTDAKIAENDLVALEDDLGFFPQYKAVFLYRLSLRPRRVAALQKVGGTLDEARMIRLNAEAERTKNYARAADLYFRDNGETFAAHQPESLAHKIMRWTARHLELAASRFFSRCSWAFHSESSPAAAALLGHVILAGTGAVQTIPRWRCSRCSCPCRSSGSAPAPRSPRSFSTDCCRSCATPPPACRTSRSRIRESAIALGLTSGARLRQIYLPIASRTILAGIKTSAVINIGTATLAALIGAGGLGEPIFSGLNLNDHATILQGAIPAAILALLVQWSFDFLDRLLIPQRTCVYSDRMAIASVNPATGETLRTFSAPDDGQIENKLRARARLSSTIAEAIFEVRARMSSCRRRACSRRTRTDSRAPSRSRWANSSAPPSKKSQMRRGCRFYAENAERLLGRRRLFTDARAQLCALRPIGPVLAIMPWNFPFWQVFRFAAPALMAGNVGFAETRRQRPAMRARD